MDWVTRGLTQSLTVPSSLARSCSLPFDGAPSFPFPLISIFSASLTLLEMILDSLKTRFGMID